MSASKDYFKKAEQAAKKQNFEYAIELYMQGLMIDPRASDERRQMHRVMTLAVEEKGGNAQGSVAVKFKVMPVLANVKKLKMQKKWDEAIIEIEKALRFQPQHSGTLFELALALEANECTDGAIVILEDIVASDRGHVESYRKLGHLWAEKEEPEKAISYWEKLRQYKPDDKEAGKAIRNLSAATMVKKAEERKAASGDDSFKAMLADEDKSAELEKKAKIIRTDEDRKEAIKFKKEELREDPKNSRLWRELGGLYQDLRQWKYAEAAFRKALEVNPHDLFVGERLGALRETRLEQEIDALRKKVDDARTNGGLTDELEQQLDNQEQKFREFKVEEYARRVKAHPTDYELKMRFGHVLMDVEQYDRAIEQFQKAVQDPKFKVAALVSNGKCFFNKGLPDLAITQYKTALRDVSSDPNSQVAKEIKYNLGLVFESKGDRGGALEIYQEIMAVDIGYEDVSRRVSDLMSES